MYTTYGLRNTTSAARWHAFSFAISTLALLMLPIAIKLMLCTSVFVSSKTDFFDSRIPVKFGLDRNHCVYDKSYLVFVIRNTIYILKHDCCFVLSHLVDSGQVFFYRATPYRYTCNVYYTARTSLCLTIINQLGPTLICYLFSI